MKPSRLVFGLFVPCGLADPALAARLRDLSLSWARFGYQGPCIEGPGIALILDRAARGRHDFCLVLAAGTIFDENWYPAHWRRPNFHQSLEALIEQGDFLAAGLPTEGPGPARLDARCLLVNLSRYAACGRPELDGAALEVDEPAAAGPSFRGWVLRDSALSRRARVRSFDAATAAAIVHLDQVDDDPATLAQSKPRFLAKVSRQADGARRGVFPWNLESYDDVDLPPEGHASPLSAVYGVAAGFKVYRILQTHGFEPDARVVFFDYSPRALEFRQFLLTEWDGFDYPRVLRKAFRVMPPDTFFQLWDDTTPSSVLDRDLEAMWKAETDRWGGEAAFQEHWNRCRSLPHDFICCDLLEDRRSLLARIPAHEHAALWWSNAFFTIYSNWSFPIEERRRRYRAWIRDLAAQAPSLLLYGADHMNASVNSIRAGELTARLDSGQGDEFHQARHHRVQIRS